MNTCNISHKITYMIIVIYSNLYMDLSLYNIYGFNYKTTPYYHN